MIMLFSYLYCPPYLQGRYLPGGRVLGRVSYSTFSACGSGFVLIVVTKIHASLFSVESEFGG